MFFRKPIDKRKIICYNEDTKGKGNQKTSTDCNLVNTGGNDMKLRNPKIFLRAVKETHYPFVDKTRTMTGRVSENI